MSNRQLPELASKIRQVIGLIENPECWTTGTVGWLGTGGQLCIEGAIAKVDKLGIAKVEGAEGSVLCPSDWKKSSALYAIISETAHAHARSLDSAEAPLPEYPLLRDAVPLHVFNDFLGHDFILTVLHSALENALTAEGVCVPAT